MKSQLMTRESRRYFTVQITIMSRSYNTPSNTIQPSTGIPGTVKLLCMPTLLHSKANLIDHITSQPAKRYMTTRTAAKDICNLLDITS